MTEVDRIKRYRHSWRWRRRTESGPTFLGDDSEVLEKAARTGGLCRSFEKEGFTFDLGGHILFSKDEEILNLELSLLQGKLNRLKRNAACWFKNRLVKYPFENGLAALDKGDAYECVLHFVSNAQRPQNNFEDWIYNTFGKGLAEALSASLQRKDLENSTQQNGLPVGRAHSKAAGRGNYQIRYGH